MRAWTCRGAAAACAASDGSGRCTRRGAELNLRLRADPFDGDLGPLCDAGRAPS